MRHSFPEIYYFIAIVVAVIVFSLITLVAVNCNADEALNAEDCIRAIIGESSNQGEIGMLALATGILNRGTLKGVYGLNAKHIDNEPQWVHKMARRAYYDALNAMSEGRAMHSGTHWGSTVVDKDWIAKMKDNGFILCYEYKDHKFYKESK